MALVSGSVTGLVVRGLVLPIVVQAAAPVVADAMSGALNVIGNRIRDIFRSLTFDSTASTGQSVVGCEELIKFTSFDKFKALLRSGTVERLAIEDPGHFLQVTCDLESSGKLYMYRTQSHEVQTVYREWAGDGSGDTLGVSYGASSEEDSDKCFEGESYTPQVMFGRLYNESFIATCPEGSSQFTPRVFLEHGQLLPPELQGVIFLDDVTNSNEDLERLQKLSPGSLVAFLAPRPYGCDLVKDDCSSLFIRGLSQVSPSVTPTSSPTEAPTSEAADGKNEEGFNYSWLLLPGGVLLCVLKIYSGNEVFCKSRERTQEGDSTGEVIVSVPDLESGSGVTQLVTIELSEGQSLFEVAV